MHAMTQAAGASELPENELLSEILARRRWRLPKATIALAAVLVVALAFVVGAEVQKHYGTAAASSSSGSTAAAAFARARASGGLPSFGGNGAPAGGGFGAAAGSGTTGTVTLIKGSTLYVTDSSGNTVLVKTSPASRVTKTVASSVKNVRPGAVVTIVGTQAKDGSYTATSISVANGANGG